MGKLLTHEDTPAVRFVHDVMIQGALWRVHSVGMVCFMSEMNIGHVPHTRSYTTPRCSLMLLC